MDVISILQTDHQRILDLFQDAGTAGEPGRLRQLVNRIRQEFAAHVYVEETVFFPIFARYEEFGPHLRKVITDQQNLRSRLEQLAAAPAPETADGAEPRERLRDLERLMAGHVRDMETEIFPRVRKLMRRPERDQIGRLAQAARQLRTEKGAA